MTIPHLQIALKLYHGMVEHDYTIVASLYDNIPNLIFSGTGTRYLPNKDITVCERPVIDGPTVDNSINKDLYKGTMERYGTGNLSWNGYRYF